MATEGLGKALSIGGINVASLFAQVDKDGDGIITQTEFSEICKLMDINISQENLMKIFSLADKAGRRYLDMEQFMYAFFRLRLLVAYEALAKMGLTKDKMMIAFAVSVVFLLMLFVFIFCVFFFIAFLLLVLFGGLFLFGFFDSVLDDFA